MTDSIDIREIALIALTEILEKDSYSHLVMNQVLRNYQYLSKQERSFLTRLCEGTVERKIQIDYIINQYSKVKVNKMKPVIRVLLRMGVYQILFMDSVPDSAACNEAVKLAGKKGFVNLKGFVNGVLRTVSRQKQAIEYPSEQDTVQYLSISYSVPEWIVTDWLKDYSKEQVLSMLQASLSKRPTTIRCNQNKITPEHLREQLTEQGITVSEGSYLNYALKIADYDSLNLIEEFRSGCFQVQDESSMLAVEAAGIKEGDYIIDVCSAPGGKSLLASEKAGMQGRIDARDLTDTKTALIGENIERMGTHNISTKVWDARVLDESSIQKADVVIADLPCSGLGVIGRKSDIKYKMTKEKQMSLIQLQREILHTVQEYVKPGGTLLFSTCTVHGAENLGNAEWFMENYPFEPDSIESYIPRELCSDTAKQGYLQLLPGIHDTDGFFIARFKRKI